MDLIVRVPGVDNRTPEQLAADGVFPTQPLCNRCKRQATDANPVRVEWRRSWNPVDHTTDTHFDVICAACLTGLRGN